MWRHTKGVGAVTLTLIVGCGSVDTVDVPDNTDDAAQPPAPLHDAGVLDSGGSEVDATDAGSGDAGSTDAGSSDTGTPDAASSDTGLPDTGSTDAGICASAATCAAPDVPAGWSPVAFVQSPQGNCPTGWSTGDDYVTNVTNGSASCSCDCSITTPPNCTTGTTVTKFSIPPGCGQTGASVMFTNGACVPIVNGHFSPYYSGSQIPASGGSCAVQPVASGALQTTPAKLCVPDAACQAAACEGRAPPGYAACIVTEGNKSCPASSAFSVKHTIAKSASPGCTSTCGTGCTFQGQCTAGQFHAFAESNCKTSIVTLANDGTCVPSTVSSATTVLGATYSATASFTGCTAKGTSTVQPTLTTQRTVCCQP